LSFAVRIEPSGVELSVPDGQTVFHAARQAGYRWPTVCGGQGTCRTCFVRVSDGHDHCSAIAALEREGIEALRRPLDGRTRLACQLRVTGPVTLTRAGVRRADADAPHGGAATQTRE